MCILCLVGVGDPGTELEGGEWQVESFGAGTATTESDTTRGDGTGWSLVVLLCQCPGYSLFFICTGKVLYFVRRIL